MKTEFTYNINSDRYVYVCARDSLTSCFLRDELLSYLIS